MKAISQRLGHSSTDVTMDTYGHVLEGVGKETARRFEETNAKAAI